MTAERFNSDVIGNTTKAPTTTKKSMRADDGLTMLEQVALTSYVSMGVTPNVTARKSKLTPIKSRAAELSAGIGYVISAACSRVMGVKGPDMKP